MGKEYQRECRVCLSRTKNPISLKATCEKLPELIYINMLNTCTQLDAVVDDALPQHLCTSCKNNLIFAFDFLQLARDSDCKLKQLYETTRQTRSSGNKLKLYSKNMEQLNKPDLLQINDGDKSCVVQNRSFVGSNAKVAFFTYTRDPLEETDEEIDVV